MIKQASLRTCVKSDSFRYSQAPDSPGQKPDSATENTVVSWPRIIDNPGQALVSATENIIVNVPVPVSATNARCTWTVVGRLCGK